MSAAKHTPGPWIFGDWINNKKGVHDRAGWVEVWSKKENLPFIACKHVDELANARLIAAAPELLKELENLVSGICLLHGDKAASVTKKARAAIAKATGETS